MLACLYSNNILLSIFLTECITNSLWFQWSMRVSLNGRECDSVLLILFQIGYVLTERAY